MSRKLLQRKKKVLIELRSAVWSHLETLSVLFSVSARTALRCLGSAYFSLVVLQVVAPASVIKDNEFASIAVANAACSTP